jgi:hypothetical protein
LIKNDSKDEKEKKIESYSSFLLDMMAHTVPDKKEDAKKDKDSDAEMMDEGDELKAKEQDKDDKKENAEIVEQSNEKMKEADKQGDKKGGDSAANESSHPQVKLMTKENDAEMLKPAEISDSENVEDSEVPKEKSKEADKKAEEGET